MNLVHRKFQVPRRKWPVLPRGIVNSVQKLLKSEHVRGGLPNANAPPMYLGQNRSTVALNRLFRNRNVSTLPDGAYLYLIEYAPATGQYHKQYVRVLDLLEWGSRHFHLPTLTPGRVIIAAGELLKEKGHIKFNLESGTYTRNLMHETREYMSENNYKNLVLDAFQNAKSTQFTKQILVPQVLGRLKNLARVPNGTLSFMFGGKPTAALKKRPAYLKRNLKANLVAAHARRVTNGNSSNNNASPSPRRSARRRTK